jgi:SagB-type dehydrogenase family enzyme
LSLLRLKADAPAPVGRGSAGRPPEAAPVASRETPSEVVVDAVRLTAAPLEGTPVLAPPDDESAKALPSPDWESFQGPTLVEVLRQRRSRRNFKPRTIRPQDLARMLDMIVGPEVDHWVRVGLVVSEVQDVPDGFYWYRPGEPNRLALQKGGFIGPYLAQAALSQDWVGRANVILVLASDFEDLQSQVGPRALRSAYLAAGRIGQRAYLAAETLGWGCCGIGAFFDEDVARILDLPPETSPMYLLPLGPVKKRTHGGRATG